MTRLFVGRGLQSRIVPLRCFQIIIAAAIIGAASACFSTVAASPADDEVTLLAFHDLVISLAVVWKCDPNFHHGEPPPKDQIAAVGGPAFQVLLAKEEAANPGNTLNAFHAQTALVLRMEAALGEVDSMIQNRGCDAPEVRMYLRR